MSMFSRAFHRIANQAPHVLATTALMPGGVGGGLPPASLGTILAGAGNSILPGIGGFVGQLAGNVITSKLIDAGNGTGDIPDIPPAPGDSAGTTQVAQAGPIVAGTIRGAQIIGNLIRNNAGKVIGFVLPDGMKLTMKNALRLAETVGFVDAAKMIGVDTIHLVEGWFHHKHRRHHRRGITARQVAVTTRTIGKIERMHAKIARVASHAVHHRRSSRFVSRGRGVEVIRNG